MLSKLYMQLKMIHFNKWYQKHLTSQTILQDKIFQKLIQNTNQTQFAKEHNLSNIDSYDTYKKNFEISHYHDYKPYISLILDGNENILWPGKPLYFAKSSGSTGSPKLIPITKDSLQSQVKSYNLPLLSYAKDYSLNFINKKAFLLLTAPEKLEEYHGFKVGRISGIANSRVPAILQRNKIQIQSNNPSKNPFDFILEQIKKKSVSVIAGMPAWINELMKYSMSKANNQKTFQAKDLELILSSGTSYKPYEGLFREMISTNKHLNFREFYGSSEGFFAMQDTDDDGMLLITDQCFYEFITLENYQKKNYQKRILLKDVVKDVDYVMLVSTQFGFFSYCIGDLIKFTNLSPYRVVVTGRTEAFISIYTEHVMAMDIEKTVMDLNKEENIIKEYFVSPNASTTNEPFYEWFIVSNQSNSNPEKIADSIDQKLINIHEGYRYYRSQNKLGKAKVNFIDEEKFTKNIINKEGADHQSKLTRLEKERHLGEILSVN